MADSILDSTKKILGVDKDYDVFDVDILTHINMAFSTLHQLGIGPDDGFMIEDATLEWTAFFGETPDPRLNSVKTYVYLKVRLLFDPPSTSYLIQAMQDQVRELEWRLTTYRDSYAWTPPTPSPATDPEVIIIPSSQAWVSEP